MPAMMALPLPCWEATKEVSPTFAFTLMATSSSQELERYLWVVRSGDVFCNVLKFEGLGG